MAEGGRFPWKFQKMFQVPVGRRHERLRESLPKPPEGMAWLQHKETREWKLVPEHELLATKEKEQVQVVEEEVTVDFTNPKATVSVNASTTACFENPFNVPNSHNATAEEEDHEDLAEALGAVDLQASEATEATETASNVHQEPLPSSLPPRQQSTRTTTTSSSSSYTHLSLPPQNIITTTHIENMPTTDFSSESKFNDDYSEQECGDWELLSDRFSFTSKHSSSVAAESIGDGMAFVSRSGSIRSSSNNNNNDSLSLISNGPYKLQRSPSNSTIDSNDFSLGPSGKGILGVDYVEHVILPTDTLQGICLAYKLSASRLKRANHFSGESLQLAPKRLIIPISKKALHQGYLRVQDTDSKEYKLHAFQAEFPSFGLAEARAYLELGDWNLREACQSARDDNDWEHQQPDPQNPNHTTTSSNNKRTTTANFKNNLRAGEIRVMMNVQHDSPDGPYIKFAAQGAGYSPSKGGTKQQQQQSKPVSHNTVHAKTVKVEDVHAAAPQHNSFGVEMQSLKSSAS